MEVSRIAPVVCLSPANGMASRGTWLRHPAFSKQFQELVTREREMRGLLLWLMGVPLSVVVLLYLFHVL